VLGLVPQQAIAQQPTPPSASPPTKVALVTCTAIDEGADCKSASKVLRDSIIGVKIATATQASVVAFVADSGAALTTPWGLAAMAVLGLWGNLGEDTRSALGKLASDFPVLQRMQLYIANVVLAREASAIVLWRVVVFSGGAQIERIVVPMTAYTLTSAVPGCILRNGSLSACNSK
jgi:hypothetical protein